MSVRLDPIDIPPGMRGKDRGQDDPPLAYGPFAVQRGDLTAYAAELRLETDLETDVSTLRYRTDSRWFELPVTTLAVVADTIRGVTDRGERLLLRPLRARDAAIFDLSPGRFHTDLSIELWGAD